MVHTCVEESADVEYVHEYRLKHGCKRAVHEYVSDCKRAHSGPSDGKESQASAISRFSA